MHASTDEINLRFYYLKRIKPAISLLKKIKKITPQLLEQSVKNIQQTLHNTPHFRNNTIQSTVEEMILNESSDPIFKIWKDFRQYRKIGDQSFPQEFCSLLFTVFKELHHTTQSGDSSSFNIAENTDIEDVLYAIDLISHELNNTIELYKKEDMVFTEWIKHYWWVPVGTVCTISLKLMQHYLQKNSH